MRIEVWSCRNGDITLQEDYSFMIHKNALLEYGIIKFKNKLIGVMIISIQGSLENTSEG